VQRGAAVKVGLYGEVSARGLVGGGRDLLSGGQALGVDVMQDDGRLGQLGKCAEIREQDAGELDAAGANERDAWSHARNCSTSRQPVQE
jgi:hypothetical protein